jgi:hypothetical protein
MDPLKPADQRATPAERRLQAQIAANVRWARATDRSAETAAARRGLDAKFVREIDPDGSLPSEELAVRVEAARRAHFLRMALKSAQARRRRKARATGVSGGGDEAA